MSDDEVIVMADGGGGGRTRELLRTVILPAIDNPMLRGLDDAACIDRPAGNLVFTTDSFVVSPLFFPGGDIGRLAVCGTVNDLAMQGGRPLYLSLGLILEEGLRVGDLRRIMRSLGETAKEAGVMVVTGDTKVVERGAGNGIYINTAGLGERLPGVDTHVANARPGDRVVINGTLGDHGIAVMSVREGIRFETELVSDAAPLGGMIGDLLAAVPGIHVLRDPTRGGAAAALNDIAESSGVCVRLQEGAIPVRPEVRGACDLLGFDPLNVANEGKAVIICAPQDVDAVLTALRKHPLGADACEIGEVVAAPAGRVLLHTKLGGERMVDVPSGEDLPRIC